MIRRAARIKGADLLAIHVSPSHGLAGADPAHLARQRVLAESLGGTYHQVLGDDIPHALLDFARGVNATQLVLGVSRRDRLAQVLARDIGNDHDRGPGRSTCTRPGSSRCWRARRGGGGRARGRGHPGAASPGPAPRAARQPWPGCTWPRRPWPGSTRSPPGTAPPMT